MLWLESYLQTYRHTVIVVSHDRSFLNEVCTDTIEFKNRKLTYYKGDYDTYVKTSDEMVKNSMRVYQAYQDKRAHMMEFIDRFRAAANRAKLGELEYCCFDVLMIHCFCGGFVSSVE